MIDSAEQTDQVIRKDVGFSLTFERTSPGVFKTSFYGKDINDGDLIVMHPMATGYHQPYVFQVNKIESTDVEIQEQVRYFDQEKLVYRIKHVPCRIISKYHNTASVSMAEVDQNYKTVNSKVKLG